jgi:CBS domain-containing protein
MKGTGMGRSPSPLVKAVVDFLRSHPPFDVVASAALDAFAQDARLDYHAKGACIVKANAGTVETLFVIQRGRVHGRPPSQSGHPTDHLDFGMGEAFPIAAVFGARPTSLDYVAIEDTFAYAFDARAVDRLARESREFQRYCTHQLNGLLERSTVGARGPSISAVRSDHPMMHPLGSIIRRAPITCPPDAPIRAALGLMSNHRIGAIIVTDAAARPIGIFTERDLVRIAASGSLALECPIIDYATRELVALPSSAAASEAALAMAHRGIRHVLVIDDGRLAGIVSERDLFALQRRTMAQVADGIAIASIQGDLVRAAQEIRGLADSLLAQGIGAQSLTALISTLNDRLTQRVLDLTAGRHAIQDVPMCWVALGSEGRQEQTIATDQDNAIIFAAPAGAPDAPIRDRLLSVAREVNETLDACGFPRCKGNIMASNPELCQSLETWRAQFEHWMRSLAPEALLHSMIFFDFRPIWGHHGLADELRSWLADTARDRALYQRCLAEEAVRTRAPIGFFGGLVTSGEDSEHRVIDLKRQGTRLFVDVARVYALKLGIKATNTVERMRAAAKVLAVADDDVEAAVDAFHFLQMLRLRQQHLEPASPNQVDPADLNELDRRILKESLRRARAMQQRIALDYRL